MTAMSSQPAENEPSGVDEGVTQPSSAGLALAMVGLCVAVFLTGMVSLTRTRTQAAADTKSLTKPGHMQDQTILATAVPVISKEFNTSEDIGWWSNAYFLTLSSFQLFYGKLYSLYPIKLVYLVAIVLFEIGSLVCTVAPNSVALIVGRALAGLGAAGIFSGSVLILTKLGMTPLLTI
jgi:MFS family permease